MDDEAVIELLQQLNNGSKSLARAIGVIVKEKAVPDNHRQPILSQLRQIEDSARTFRKAIESAEHLEQYDREAL